MFITTCFIYINYFLYLKEPNKPCQSLYVIIAESLTKKPEHKQIKNTKMEMLMFSPYFPQSFQCKYNPEREKFLREIVLLDSKSQISY